MFNLIWGKREINFPVWNQPTQYIISVKDVTAALAYWAVKQSPYHCPDNLKDALAVLETRIRKKLDFDQFNFTKTTYQELEATLSWALETEHHPVFKGWNTPKEGNARNLYVSRLETIKPDYDFIDLTALARNTAQLVWLNAEYDKL